MRHATTIFAALIGLGCFGGDAGKFPVEPAEPVPRSAFLIGYVVDGSGDCIPGGRVRVVRGQRAGETLTQTTPCNIWGYENGFIFHDLTAGGEMTLEASAPGYGVLEKRVVPRSGPQMAIEFYPPRLP